MTGVAAPPVETAEDLPAALLRHWAAWLGADERDLRLLGRKTATTPMIRVVASPARLDPGWDGQVHLVTGVVDPTGSAVVSVPPEVHHQAQTLVNSGAGVDALRAALPQQLGCRDLVVYRAVYRWAGDVPAESSLPPAGQWLPVADERVPAWLEPFGGEALVALDAEDNTYLAGVGFKRHDADGHEIAVGTSEAARGRGLARRLVAQAARHLLAAGVVPTYQHDPANVASARVADAAGFPDRGWTSLGAATEER